MASKENYCYRILKSHSLIVDFEGTPTRKNVPAIVDGETFKSWKNRVLGNNVTDVVVYVPDTPAPQTKISTLQNWSGAEHLEQIFNAFGKAKDKKRIAAVETAVNETEHSLVTFSRDTLEQLLEEHGDSLEPSVRDFFKRFLNETEENINTEELIRDLIKHYNTVAKMFRERG